MELLFQTGPEWLRVALADFNTVLSDHAHCEKKAAANALSMLQAYPEVPGLPAQMARLAREESAHLAKVLQVMEERGVELAFDGGDPYVKGLLEFARNGKRERRLDRLLIAGIVEARSFERLQLLAEALEDVELRALYSELAKSEDGHQKLFVRLAEGVEPAADVAARLNELIASEAALLERLPVRAAIH